MVKSGTRVTAIVIGCFLLISSNGLASGGACPAGVPVTGNNCYFIAASGSDSNNGTSESTPWLHAPGMPNCTNNCAGLGATSGLGIILRGGDTWHFGTSTAPATGGNWDLYDWYSAAYTGQVSNCVYEGTQTGCIYVGVDKNWYSGASWSRPILTGDNATSTTLVPSCAHQIPSINVMLSLAAYMILDNFEMTGNCTQDVTVNQGNDTYITIPGTAGGSIPPGPDFLENLYIHGWTATTNAGTGNNVQPGTLLYTGVASSLQFIDHIVIDGADSNPGSWAWGTFPSFYHMRDSIVRYTNQGVGQYCHDIHDNIFEHMYDHNPSTGSHTNILECNDDAPGGAPGQPTGVPNVFYNNIVRHDQAGYPQVHLWFCPETSNEYWFNNLVYDVTNVNVWDIAGPPLYNCNSSGTGRQFMFNNTLVDITQPCYLPLITGGGSLLTISNEHLINAPLDSGTTPCAGYNSSSNIAISDSAATAQGYTLGSSGTAGTGNSCANDTTPCAPTASGNGTVGAGTNNQSYCTALAGFTQEYAIGIEAANACKYSTTDGCLYVVSSHSMSCPGQVPAARPSSAWDSGAYQYGSGTPPLAPTKLNAVAY